MNIADIIGLTAAALSSISMSPQVIKIHQTKKTSDLSLWAFSTLSTGLLLWFIYGLLIKSFPVIIGNAGGLCFVLYIVFMKIKYG